MAVQAVHHVMGHRKGAANVELDAGKSHNEDQSQQTQLQKKKQPSSKPSAQGRYMASCICLSSIIPSSKGVLVRLKGPTR